MGNLRKCVLDSHKVLNLLADVLDKVLVTGQPQQGDACGHDTRHFSHVHQVVFVAFQLELDIRNSVELRAKW